jgi:hypothetical protein
MHIPGSSRSVRPLSEVYRPRFQGLTATARAEATLLNGRQLQEVLSIDTTPYVGRSLPPLFPPDKKTSAYAELDHLAEVLKGFDVALFRMAGFSQPFTLPPLAVTLGGVPARLDFVGAGNFGLVFKLTANGQSAALKVFFPRHRELYDSGPYSETATGVYLTSRHVQNTPRLWMANPGAGWMLSDFVDATYQPRLEALGGPTWESLGFEAIDAEVKENQIQGAHHQQFRPDFGHLSHPNRSADMIPAPLAQLFIVEYGRKEVPTKKVLALLHAEPSVRPMILERLRQVNPADRLQVIREALRYPEFRHFTWQEFFQFGTLTEAQLAEWFQILMAHPDPAVRAKAVMFPPNNPELLAQMQRVWKSRPEFLPFRIAQGETDLLFEYLQRFPGLSLRPLP